MDLKNIKLEDIKLEDIKAKLLGLADKKTLIKFGISFGAIVVFLIIYYSILNPIVNAKKAKLAEMNAKQEEIIQISSKIKASKKKIKKLRPKYEEYSTLFHTRAEVEGLYQTLSYHAEINGLVISRIEKQKILEVSKDEALGKTKKTSNSKKKKKESTLPNYALADFVAPKDSNTPDYIGGFAVTTGHGVQELVAKYEADHDDYNAILVKALADRLAEAFAEYLHAQARKDCGFGQDEQLSNQDLINERYRGIRPAPGYPACPDHTEKGLLFDLLDAEKHTGISLTESFAMMPAASVSGLYFNHPQSKYFAVGFIGRDQVEDYAKRKDMSLEKAEQWLAPQLNYDPNA